jgi:hypothetical protein
MGTGTFCIDVHAGRGDVGVVGPEGAEAVDERVPDAGDDAHGDQDHHQDDLDVVYLALHLAHLVVHLSALVYVYPWLRRILLS